VRSSEAFDGVHPVGICAARGGSFRFKSVIRQGSGDDEPVLMAASKEGFFTLIKPAQGIMLSPNVVLMTIY